MTKDTKNVITINDKEYNVDEFSEKAKAIFEHTVDLQRKIKTAKFNLIQLEVGLNAFVTELKAELDGNTQ